MELLKELWNLQEEKSEKKKKKDKRDKSADKYFQYVSGNLLFNQTCSGKLAGDKT